MPPESDAARKSGRPAGASRTAVKRGLDCIRILARSLSCCGLENRVLIRPARFRKRGAARQSFFENWIRINHTNRPRILAERTFQVSSQPLQTRQGQRVEQKDDERFSRKGKFG